jgi:glycosyltransferase involved in cell wall biosynthesis
MTITQFMLKVIGISSLISRIQNSKLDLGFMPFLLVWADCCHVVDRTAVEGNTPLWYDFGLYGILVLQYNPSNSSTAEFLLSRRKIFDGSSDSMTENFPLVSVVIPSFNQAHYLEFTIRSILEQDYSNIEILLVDGGSTDGSLEIIQRYAHRLAWWVSEKDRGQTDAINKGFARAKGQILAWLNSDDTYEPGAVTEAVAFLQAHPEVGLVYGNANFIDGKGSIIGHFPAARTDYQRLRNGYVHIPQQAAFWCADLWKKVGPLDPSFYFAMDYDLWVRLAAQAPIEYIPRLWANFRLHSTGKTVAADDRCWPEMLKVHYRDGGSWFSIITLKYFIRRLIAPLLRLRMQIRLAKGNEFK